MEQKFFYCKHCGKIIGMIFDPGTPTICCGEPMQELIANTSDGAKEKHVPVVKVTGDTIEVTIGSVLHPMIPEHFIQWIYLQTKKGGQRKRLSPGEEPKAVFVLKDDEPVTAFEYCNLHGLWKADI
ncbi:MAG: desulfoferrodoxin family protein [Flexilinea sp.]